MPDDLPVARIVHVMAGRARLRISDRRGDSVFFASLATGLSTIPGVSKVEVRALTGSVLVQHTAPLQHIGTAAEKARLFVLGDSLFPPPMQARPIDARTAVGLGLGVLTLWQITEGRILPPAITLAWYAAILTGLLSDGEADDGAE